MPAAVSVQFLGPTIWPPQLDITPLPPEEHDLAKHIGFLLASLTRYEKTLWSAVALFDSSHAENSRLALEVSEGKLDWHTLNLATNTLGEWQMMSAREGALAIYHFGKTIEAIRQTLRSTPVLDAKLNQNELRQGAQLFRHYFPRFEAIRHVVSHAADFSATPRHKEEHGFRERKQLNFGAVGIAVAKGGQFSDNLYDRNYCVTFKGKLHTYEISVATAQKVVEAKSHLYLAFSPRLITIPSR